MMLTCEQEVRPEDSMGLITVECDNVRHIPESFFSAGVLQAGGRYALLSMLSSHSSCTALGTVSS